MFQIQLMELQNSNDRILNSQNKISQLGQTYASKKTQRLKFGYGFSSLSLSILQISCEFRIR